MNSRNKTPSVYIGYALYFYFSGLSLRRTAAERLLSSCFIKRNHVSIWNWWIQKFKPQKILLKKTNIWIYNRDETLIKIGSWELVWLWWVDIEPKHRQILHIDTSFERTMLIVAERFIAFLINRHGKHPVSTEMVVRGNLKHANS